ncbi:MAG TPA: dipeptide epimerase [Firmicutes bacterium]|nr:dipeptide epimerase [Bacillota bacterium]
MKVTKANVYSISVPKKSVFAVAYAVRKAAESIIVCLHTDTGLIGVGEAVPVKEVTGESKKEVYLQLKDFCQAIEGFDFQNHEEILEEAKIVFANMPSALCAIDTAIWDIKGQLLKKPLYKIWGGAKDFCQASFSLGILPIEETLEETEELVTKGISHLKYKIGLNIHEDIRRIKKVRENYPNIKIYLDANQGYTVKEALEVVRELATYQIELMEQPVAKEDLEGLIKVAQNSSFPIVADEAIQDPPSLDRLLQIGTVPIINIKLMKCGGPSNALSMMQTAKNAGISVMIGCMIETRVGITTGLHVAQSQDIVQYIDLDGCWDLSEDIVSQGGAILESGKEYVSNGTGLGVCLDKELLLSLVDEGRSS